MLLLFSVRQKNKNFEEEKVKMKPTVLGTSVINVYFSRTHSHQKIAFNMNFRREMLRCSRVCASVARTRGAPHARRLVCTSNALFSAESGATRSASAREVDEPAKVPHGAAAATPKVGFFAKRRQNMSARFTRLRHAATPYAYLMRLHKPSGALLLAFPATFGVLAALPAGAKAPSAKKKKKKILSCSSFNHQPPFSLHTLSLKRLVMTGEIVDYRLLGVIGVGSFALHGVGAALENIASAPRNMLEVAAIDANERPLASGAISKSQGTRNFSMRRFSLPFMNCLLFF
jgi:hypothetical protein